MAYTVLNLKQDLEGVMHGTTLNQITNLDGVIDRAARTLLLDVDPQETLREVPFSTPVFNQVYSYALASDVKGNTIVDIRPQVNRTSRDIYNQDYSQQFDLSKFKNMSIAQFNIKFDSGVKTIDINDPWAPPPVVLNTASGVTLNGTWTAGGDASNLTTNNVNSVNYGGSLQFDLAAAGSSGYLEVSNMDAVDLTDHLNQATEFLWFSAQTGSGITSVTLRWGSDSSNYYTRTATTDFAGNAFVNGWNNNGYNWNGATVVGTPDVTDITYLRVTFNYDGTAQTGMLLNSIGSQLGQILSYVYYSKYLFRNSSTGAFQENVLDDSDIINLDTESYNMLFYQVAYLASQQQQGSNALGYDGKFFADAYEKATRKYKDRYKSQVQKPRQMYYKKPNPSYGWGAVGPWWPRG